jgi:dihydrolipoamide dehydrogenase
VTRIAILGAGPGGYVAAARARQLGAEVTLVEMDALGGVCLNRGCIPSKTLLKSADVIRMAGDMKDFGVAGECHGCDWPAVLKRKERVVSQLVKGVEFLMKSNGVQVVRGRGRLLDAHTISVDTGGKEETVGADKIIIATGSSPAVLPIPGGQPPVVMTSDDALSIESIPASMAIIGGGVISSEFADLFNALGSKVTVIEMLPRIVPLEDEEVSAELQRLFRRRKIDVYVNARVSEVAERDGKRVVCFGHEGADKEVEAEVVLSAVGRRLNTESIGLEEVGVRVERRRIQVNEKMETNVPGVYAIGDAIGGYLLAHVASAEGKVAVANAMGADLKMDYSAIPSAVYTHPEIGSVGMTEVQAKEQGHEVKVGRFPFRASGRALSEGARDGFVKVVADAATDQVLGGHVIGHHATDIIHELVMAIQLRATASVIGDMVHAHPTLAEPIMEAAEDIHGRAIHK